MNGNSDFSRRGFVKAAALSVAGAAAVSMTACTGSEQKEDAAGTYEKEVDVIVLGGGNGGLTAAARAAEGGKSVLLLEASGYLGGGSKFAGGSGNASMHIMGTKTWETYNEENPYTAHTVDPEIGRPIVETFYGDYTSWLLDNDIAFHKTEGTQSYMNDYTLGWGGEEGKGGNIAFFDTLADYATSAGVEIALNIFGRELLLDDEGRITGVRAVSTIDGAVHSYKARSVVLACGGFQCNKGLMARFVGKGGESIQNIGTPYNTGAGLMMAESVGAQTAGWFDSMNAVLAPYLQTGNASESVALFNEVQQGDPNGGYPEINTSPCPGSLSSLVINLDGKRIYTDSDLQLVLQQKRSRVVVISDQAACEAYDASPSWVYPSSEAYFEFVKKNGGFVIEGETIEELAANLQATTLFTPSQTVAKTLTEYNELLSSGRADELDPPLMNADAAPLVGPFRAVVCVQATYYMHSGVKINGHAQVIGVDQQPIPGLYATVPCAGTYQYLGGLAASGASGFLAANHIAES